jgi:hypothetical protein
MVGLAACGAPGAGDVETDLPVWPHPEVEILAPADGAEVAGEALLVRFRVANLVLEPPGEADTDCPAASAVLWPGPLGWAFGTAWAHCPGDQPVGYLLVRVNGREVAQISSTEGVLPLDDVEPGLNLLAVEARWPDGDAFDPIVTARAAFTKVEP